MFQKIENFMKKIVPGIDRESEQREEATRQVVVSSAEARLHIHKTIFESYRAAGISLSREKKKDHSGL